MGEIFEVVLSAAGSAEKMDWNFGVLLDFDGREAGICRLVKRFFDLVNSVGRLPSQ